MQSKARVGRTQHVGDGRRRQRESALAEVYRTPGALTRTLPTALRSSLLGLLLALGSSLLSSGCQTNPVTGESEFNLYSERDDIALGQEAYAGVLQGEPLVSSGQQLAMVERVMQRIAAVSHRPNYPWEVVLIDDPSTVNAFCLPGGKMAVYTGILPLCDDPQFGLETGLAVVMGHEIAHATHRHGTNRLTRAGFAEAAIAFTPTEWQEQAAAGYQLFFGLPFSRSHETESDLTGQEYMAKAGYDPRAASSFWMRMGSLSGGSAGLEWLSTHPSDTTRSAALDENLQSVLGYYENSPWR